MNDMLKNIQDNLRIATNKELINCIKGVNQLVDPHSRLNVSGRKDEIISRLAKFVVSLIANDRHKTIKSMVHIVNSNMLTKVTWKYEDKKLVVNRKSFSPAVPNYAGELNFKPSPFYKQIKRISSIELCPISNGTRQTKSFVFTLAEENRRLLTVSNLEDGRPPYQLRFYCSKYSKSYDDLFVEFPTVCELRINDNLIQGNKLRCIKGKPGTVNPPDISIMTRKQASNNVELVYINNEEPFIASVYLVERKTVSQLIQTMKNERMISKEEVLEKFQKIQQDSDVIMESETISTKDPLAFTRIITPIRSKSCQHHQCFDATVFFTMNEQTPTWSCPVCYKPIDNWEDLIIDGYFAEILINTPNHIDSVHVEPNGNITIIDENPDLSDQQSDEEPEHEPKEDLGKDAEPKESVVSILIDDEQDDEQDENSTSILIPTDENVNNKNAGQHDSIKMHIISLNSDKQKKSNKRKQKADTKSKSTKKKHKANDEAIETQTSPKKQQIPAFVDLTLDSDDEPEIIS